MNDEFSVCEPHGLILPCFICNKNMDKHEKDCRCENCESSRIDEVMAAEKARPDFEERLAATLTAVRFDFRRREREAR